MENLTVELKAVGNPDHGQYGSMGIPTRRVSVASLAEASATCRVFIENEDLGSGNWAGGRVFKGGKVIARVSYNGRVWDTNDQPIAI
jgi:hypothetical protein